MNYKHFSDVHNSRAISRQLFEVLDFAWQDVLADSGNHYDARYRGLGAVGLALLTAHEREPAPEGGDNPLNLFTGTRRVTSLLRDMETTIGGPMKYRYNHKDAAAALDPTLLGLRRLDQIYDRVLIHGRYPINAAAKRHYMINNPDALTSYVAEGPAGEFNGELRAAGAIRILGRKAGIVAVGGGNQLHDHMAAAHWAFMADGAITKPTDELDGHEVDALKVALSTSLRSGFEQVREFSFDTFGTNIDGVPHEEYGALIDQANEFLQQAA